MMTKSDEEYSSSDSEEEYTENEKRLLKNVRDKPQEASDSENEVFGVASSEPDSDSEDDKSDLALSDIEGQDVDDYLPDNKAWGKNKRNYYNTDYVDPDYGGFHEKDAQLAEQEGTEAQVLQKELNDDVPLDGLIIDLLQQKATKDTSKATKGNEVDFSKLSKREKLKVLHEKSPELFQLIDDYKEKMTTAKDYCYPIIQKYKSGQITKCPAFDFVETFYKIILNYCTNISAYLYLKSAKVNVQKHPVAVRLLQYRQLLNQMEPVFEDIIKEQLDVLLSQEDVKEVENEKVTKKLKFLASLANEKTKTEKRKKQVTFVEEPIVSAKKVKLNESILEENEEIEKPSSASEDEGSGEDNVEVQSKEETENDISKRAITYEMAKNKGLTPHRKKEQRNPRVKHKLKYRKAVIRRKGAVREPRKELSRYSGEISGIKATVSRSIKLK